MKPKPLFARSPSNATRWLRPLVVMTVLLVWLFGGCEPQECREMHAKVCQWCGDDGKPCRDTKGKTDADACRLALDQMNEAEKLMELLPEGEGVRTFCEGWEETAKP